MIEVSNLTKKFNNVAAVDNVSFSVPQGELMVLIGTSGCGKTTTLKMINRLIEPSSGSILIKNKDICKQNGETLRREIGYVIQNTGLFPHYTVAQNIAVVPNLLHWEKQRIQKRTAELMEIVGLPQEFLSRFPGELSGGQQQRVGIARALAADPPVVLLDEPFGALDPITRNQVQKEFCHLQSVLNKTMVLVTHDMFESVELGDKICLMDKGIVQQIGTPKELLFSPANDFVKDFFANNRFQLELKVLKIKDILEEIPNKQTEGEVAKIVEETMSLLDVLKEIEEVSLKKSILQIVNSSQEEILKTTSENILSAFYKTKIKMVERN